MTELPRLLHSRRPFLKVAPDSTIGTSAVDYRLITTSNLLSSLFRPFNIWSTDLFVHYVMAPYHAENRAFKEQLPTHTKNAQKFLPARELRLLLSTNATLLHYNKGENVPEREI